MQGSLENVVCILIKECTSIKCSFLIKDVDDSITRNSCSLHMIKMNLKILHA